eukprot:TRINITY_DN14316_c0_g1_i1.p1 TRINITY_DN14316_c0_g1~~TRINITY_DN14316_c0_g1_i1.p1  ORF type:complete len:116 (-),score=32.91 TRINITY_DN14316_c0_g1_i1:49-375(-)
MCIRDRYQRRVHGDNNMGSLFTKLKELLFGKNLELVLVGLENSGKTTFANQLAYGEPRKTLPTFGLNVRYAKKDSNNRPAKNRPNNENMGFRRTTTIQRRVATICKNV